MEEKWIWYWRGGKKKAIEDKYWILASFLPPCSLYVSDIFVFFKWPSFSLYYFAQFLFTTVNKTALFLLCYHLLFIHFVQTHSTVKLVFWVLRLFIPFTFPNFLFLSLPCHLFSLGPLTKFLNLNSKLYFWNPLGLEKASSQNTPNVNPSLRF